MVDYTVDTGELMEWAKKMEEKGADFGAEVMKEVKHHHERQRKQGMRKFSKIRRARSGVKRFAIKKAPDKAQLISKNAGSAFSDVFKEQ
jgi:hypothetical protein